MAITFVYEASEAVTVTTCEPTVVAILVHTDINSVADIDSSLAVYAVIPEAGTSLIE